jgi:DNA-binding NarL/FixJ family response regulator
MQSANNPIDTDDGIGVLIVDDHPIFRQGIRHLLEEEDGIDPKGEAASVEQALAWLGSHRADVALLDHNLPGTNGVEGLPSLLAAQYDLQVVVLTVCDEDAVFLQAIRSGACGYVLKDAPPDRLLDAIRAGAQGECRVSERMVRILFQGVERAAAGDCVHCRYRQTRPAGVPALPSLTEREMELLGQLSHGLSNKEIARELGLSPNTVRNQLQRLQERFSARNRVQLALLARDFGAQ